MQSSDDPSSIFAAIVPTAFGAVGIRTQDAHLHEVVYLPETFAEKAPSDAVADQAVRQIQRYLDDPDFRFDLPLREAGSDFQRRVWAVISGIPRGSVRTYGDVARAIASAPRAVGQACGANWFPLIIPCHRVTGSNGLGGFASCGGPDGFHVGIKRWLLAHEGVTRYLSPQ